MTESIAVPAHAPAPLRERLVETTLQLVAAEGVESLTLRRIARRAGVSHGAPLRHFASLSDLLAEVAAHGFRLLASSLEASASELPNGAGPLARLRAAGRAYVSVAVDHPGLFTLMFLKVRLDTDNARFQADAGAAFEQLVRSVQAAQDAGWCADRDTRLLSGVVWSSVHGLASLWSQGALQGPIPGLSLDEALDLGLELLISPHAASSAGPVPDPDPDPDPDQEDDRH